MKVNQLFPSFRLSKHVEVNESLKNSKMVLESLLESVWESKVGEGDGIGLFD